MKKIDLNADLGEGFGPWRMGNDEAMLKIITSANVACGGHAGDSETMFRTLSGARDNNVCVGAHPGFTDKEGFGRRRIPLKLPEIARLIAAQTGTLMGVAALVGVKVSYIKVHGALANWAAEDESVATAIATAIHAVDSTVAVLAISGTALERVARDKGITTYCEIFADRGYQHNGQLVPRGQAGAIINNVDVATGRLLKFFATGLMPTVNGGTVALDAHSICVHGDGLQALQMAQSLRDKLRQNGFTLTPFTGA